MIQALIVSHFDYGNSLCGLTKICYKRLQVMQNAAARLHLKIPNHDPVRKSLKWLHWLPVEERSKFKSLCIAHKAIKNKGRDKLRGLVSPYAPASLLRSSQEHLLSTTRIKRARWVGRSFEHLVPKLWNGLPLGIRQLEDELTFRKKLKTWLFPQ